MNKIAVIGGSYLQLPLVLKARAMGLETHCFAWLEGAVCKDHVDFFYPISIIEKEEILNKCLEIDIDGIVSIASDVAVPTVCFVGEKMGLKTHSTTCANVATDKYEMRKRFLDRGVASPPFAVVDRNNIVSGDLNLMKYPLIVKPVDRSGSRGVRKITDPAEFEEAVSIAIKEAFAERAIVEEFIEGTEISVETISFNGEHHILAITDKDTTGAPHFVEIGHHQPSLLDTNTKALVTMETLKALDALEITNGAGHAEFKITEEGRVYVIEVGARMGGDFIGSTLVELSTGFDYLHAVIDVALGRFNFLPGKEMKYAGVYFLGKDTSYLLPYFQGSNVFDWKKEQFEENLKPLTNSAERSGYLIYRSDSKITLC